MAKGFRLGWVALVALVLFAVIAFLSPQQLPVALWKFAILALAAVAGYWLDRHLFPYGRPHVSVKMAFEDARWLAVYNAEIIRRAIIVGACLVAAAISL